MRLLCLLVVTLLFAASAFASEIREFDLKTIEKLGNELTRVSQTRDRGATTPERKRAQETAKAALKGGLFNIRYDYVVLDDPDGDGFLVYALGKGTKRGDVVIHGHFRVTVSTNGQRAERVDQLSRAVLIENKYFETPIPGYHRSEFVTSRVIATLPVETLVYASNLMNLPFAVATPPKGQIWSIDNGKIKKFAEKKTN
jgi:hypothetical protein